MRIRAAKRSDLAVMRDIERVAGGAFREIGMPGRALAGHAGHQGP